MNELVRISRDGSFTWRGHKFRAVKFHNWDRRAKRHAGWELVDDETNTIVSVSPYRTLRTLRQAVESGDYALVLGKDD